MHQPNWKHSLQQIKISLHSNQGWKAVLVIFLMLANWSCEALKWRVLIGHIQKISFLTAFKAILSGLSVSVAMNTPNGAGEYFGRILYVKQGNRIRAITLTFVGSISQLIVTMFLGTIGLFLLKDNFYNATNETLHLSLPVINGIAYGSIAITAVLTGFYFELSWLVRLFEKIPFVAKYSFFIQKLEDFKMAELLKVLLISILRYSVFIIQYLLLLQLFDVGISVVTAFWLITIMFLALAIVPTVALAELGVRGKISVFLFGAFSTNTLGIVFTASAIWLINLVVPALAGSLFILGIKLFRNK
ncbi:MAG: flippase-like domain-containing protein [Bacteroidota bacterium]|nr:flippase-like domain-containing protein [Bacteroidota bacterium]